VSFILKHAQAAMSIANLKVPSTFQYTLSEALCFIHLEYRQMGKVHKFRGLQPASELCQLSDRHLSAKLGEVHKLSNSEFSQIMLHPTPYLYVE
jgi:hypothetical protein